MFGYVVPQKDCLKMQDFVLYRAFYCGICKATGSVYGQMPRFTTNYDIVFLSVLLHDCLAQEVSFNSGVCILNPFKKKATVCRNDLMDRLVAANIILSYYKAVDDEIDDRGLKRKLAKRMLQKAYGRARALQPEIDAIVKKQYADLRTIERGEPVGIDKTADCFAVLLMRVAEVLLGGQANENILKLCYNVGKFVYLVDAIDDLDDDYKQKRFNPFLSEYKNFESRAQFLADNENELKFILSITVNRAIECFNSLKLNQSYDLLENIVHKGLRAKQEELFNSKKKLPNPKI